MAGVRKKLGSLLGPRGVRGVQGDRGLPGLEAVPQAEGMAAHISTAGLVRDAVDARASAAAADRVLTMRGLSTKAAYALDRDGASGTVTRYGARVARSVAGALADVGDGPVVVSTPVTNEFGAIVGGAVGTVAFSGGNLPTGWTTGSGSAAKSILAVSSTSITFQVTRTEAATDYGSIRTAPFTPSGDVIVAFDIDMTNADPAPIMVMARLGWFNPTGSTFSDVLNRLHRSTNRAGRYYVRLPNPGGARSLAFVLAAESASAQTITLKLSNIAVYPVSVVGDDPNVQPPYTATSLPAATAVLPVDNGDYVLVVEEVSGRVRRVRVTASGGIDLAAALKWSTIRRLWAIPAAAYNGSDVSALGEPDWEATRDVNDNFAIQSAAVGAAITGSQPYVSVGNPYRGVQVSRRFPGRVRFEVHPGEVALGDSVTQERAELVLLKSAPYGVNVDAAFGFVVEQFPASPSSDYMLIAQWRYTNNAAGDSSKLSPDYSIVAYPRDAKTFSLMVVCRSDGGTPNLTGSGVPAGITTTTIWSGVLNIGQRYEVYARNVFSKTGGGSSSFYLDGVLKASGPVALGYSRDAGPHFHYGIYSNDMDGPRVVTFNKARFGDVDLSAQIAKPLPW